MDRSYKEDIPSTRRALEELKKEFSSVASTTNWTKLRIEPLLDHVKSLERLLRSPKFARETARLRRGVVMFHSDLVYLRENVKALKGILEVERKSHRRRSVRRAPSALWPAPRRSRERSSHRSEVPWATGSDFDRCSWPL